MDIETYTALGLDREFDLTREVNGRTFFADVTAHMDHPADASYHPCPEAFPAGDVERGTVDHVEGFAPSRHYAGTTRDLWVYSSARARSAGEPATLFVFNDGAMYVDPDGPVRVPAVLDSLVHAGELGPVIGVFVQAGAPAGAPHALDDLRAFRQRSIEYDTLDPEYVSFLEEEVLPLAGERAGVAITDDPGRRCIAGISSGGICAFNAAWHRPDRFALVLSHCGSFANIRGGNNFPYLVRTTDRKPIRVFLQSGEADLDTVYGNWPNANRDMAAALAYAGYEHRFVFGRGAHSTRHGGSILADSIRWLLGRTG